MSVDQDLLLEKMRKTMGITVFKIHRDYYSNCSFGMHVLGYSIIL